MVKLAKKAPLGFLLANKVSFFVDFTGACAVLSGDYG
jgi:hypothetical protein